MEWLRAEETIRSGWIDTRTAAFFLLLSRLNLGAALILLPLRFRWVLQLRPLPPVYEEYTSFYLYPADLFVTMALGFWLLSMTVDGRRLHFRPRWLTLTLFGLVGVSAASIFTSFDPWLSAYTLVRMLMLFGLYLYLIHDPPGLPVIVIPVAMQVLVQAPVAITQVLRQSSLGLATLQELPLDPTLPGTSIIWVEGLRTLRAYGLTDHPNILGGSLAFGLLLLLTAYLASPQSWRLWIGSLFGLGSLALLLTFSRSAWLGMLAGLAGFGVWAAFGRSKERLLAWAGLCGATFLLLLPFLWANAPFLGTRLNLDGSFRAASPENQSVNERRLLLDRASEVIARYPWTGVGAGAYPTAFRQLAPDYGLAYQPPHLVLAQVAAETGVFGAGFYLLALTAPWASLLRSKEKTALPLPLVGVTAALLAISLVSFLDYYPWLLNPGRLWHWLLWGLWGAWSQIPLRGDTHA